MVAIVVCLLSAVPASAHVVIFDTKGKTATVLHLNPDDDPIAGQESNLLFDVQGAALQSAMLTIINDQGERARPPVDLNDTMVGADYTFPKQGVYELRLKTVSQQGIKTFVYDQRVSRGIAGSPLDSRPSVWAQLLRVMCPIALLLLLIVAFNRRKDIAAYSTW
jgi:hypothetical protein